MATNPFVCAALAALFSLGLTAQEQAPFAQHLAAAKLAQTRGDFAAALKELRLAQETAPADQQEQVQRAVRSLEDSQAGARHQDPQGGDPVQRLIAVLDTGSDADPAVLNAYRQLGQLGNLMLPQLLAAFPKMGPFGMRNALELLRHFDDARIVDVLGKRLDGADPAVTAAIANMLSEMRRTVSVPLAHRIAAKETDEQVLVAVLRSLMKFDLDNDKTSELAMQLANSSSSSTQASVLDLIDDREPRWGVAVLDGLRQRGDEAFRSRATYEWLQRVPDLSEAKALQALQTMPAATVAGVATDLLRQHPQWVEVAMLALRSAIDSGATLDLIAFFDVPWGKHRDAAGTLLLRLPIAPHNDGKKLGHTCMALIKAGWQVPAGSEDRLAEIMRRQGSGGWTTLVTAMPADAEDRAIAVWRELSPDDQPQFAAAANKAGRSWHRLFAMQLNSAPTQEAVLIDLIKRDWTGAPAATVNELTKLTTRWPAPPTGWAGWQPSLVQAWQRTPDLPVEVILPLIEAGDRGAWIELFRRDPERALAWLRTSTNRDAADVMKVIELLRRFGTDQDVPLAIWVVHQLAGQPPTGLSEFFADHARGNIEVIALGKLPVSAHPNMTGYCVMVAIQAARGARIDDLEELLEMAPDLAGGSGDAALGALRTQLRPNDTKLLLNALEATFTRRDPWSNSEPALFPALNREPTLFTNAGLATRFLGMLEAAANPAALPRLREMLNRDDAKDIRGDIARTCLQIGGDQNKVMLAEFLKSDDAKVVAAALSAPELSDDQTLREAGVAAMLRLGEVLPIPRLEWRPADRERAAQAVVNGERYPQFAMEFSQWAVRELGRRKDTTFLKEIQRATGHRNAVVRVSAAAALGSTFSREAAPMLLELLKDDSKDVRKAAQAALDEIANYLDERKKWEDRLK